jgi:uncharacterized protein YcfJ
MKKLITIVALMAAASAHAVEYGNIISVTPVTDYVQTSKNNCPNYQEEGSGLAATIGAGLGALLGSRFGNGTGKTIATGVGAVAGGVAGYEMSKTQGGCRPIVTNEPVPGGYLVVYEYNGQTYQTRTRTIPTSNQIMLQLQPVPLTQ